MIKTNSDCLAQETVQKYAYAIRHFRGYLDKEKFEDDLAFLMNFVREVGSRHPHEGRATSEVGQER